MKSHTRNIRLQPDYLKKTVRCRRQYGGNQTQIINEYKELLTTFAVSDAIHDFGDFAKDNIPELLQGIPSASYNAYKEDAILENILISKVNDEDTILPFNMENIYMLNDVYNENVSIILEFSNNIKRSYTIKVILWELDNEVIVTSDMLQSYFVYPRTFIIDHYTLKFFDGLKNGTEDDYDVENPYYIIYNRETVNDPAKKGMFRNFNLEGLNIQVSYDNGTDRVVYPLFHTNRSINYNAMFYSKYNLELKLNIQNKCTLQFTNDNTQYTISDTKINNSIEQIKSSISNIPIDIKFQQKRSGDALQLLSVFDNTRNLTDMNAHNNTKMIVTHDRLCLYYSLLMGTDTAFTTTMKDGDDKYDVCILFINDEDKFDSSYNFRGGYQVNKPLKRRFNKTKKNIKVRNKMSIDNTQLYTNFKRLIDMPIEDHTTHTISCLCMMFINYECYYERISDEYKNNINLIQSYYYSINDYYDIHVKKILYQIIQYYSSIDIELANCIRSVICLATINRIYEVDLGESFGEFHSRLILQHATPEILKELEQYPDSRKPYEMWNLLSEDRFNEKKYIDIYEEVNHCAAWDIDNYNRLMQYIMDNELDVYSTVMMLSGSYGVQTVAESIIEFSGFPYQERKMNTPEMKELLNVIHKLPRYDNLKGWKYMKGRIEDYLQTTFEKRLIWGAKFW